MPKPPKRRRKGDRVEESVLAVPLEEEVPAAVRMYFVSYGVLWDYVRLRRPKNQAR